MIPRLASRTRVLVLQHPSESGHALNTGRLAALGLANAALEVGERFDPALWQQAGYQPCVLFPGDGAEPLAAGGPARLLIVPDGTWRKARKLLYLNPALAALPRVCLGNPGPSNYRVRKAQAAGALATIEAIAQALEALEAPASFQPLLRPFEALIEGQIRAMGAATYARNHQRQ